MDKQNKEPSVYTVLYWFFEDKKNDPKILFNFLEFFWPTFTRKDSFVFLKEKFSEGEYNRLISEKVNPEYWINLLTVNDFFAKIPHGDKFATKLAKTLVEIWQAKLKKDFPNLCFTVEFLHDKAYGDYGLTFYQKTGQNS